MKLKKTLLALGIVTSSIIAAPTFAHNNSINTDQCDIELNYDLSISPEHIRIIEDDETLIDIYKNNIVFIKGEQIELSSNQQTLVSDYSTSIRQAVPEVVDIAVEAIAVAYEALEVSLGQFGDISHTHEKFEKVQQAIVDKYNDAEGHYSFRGGELNIHTDDDEEIEQLVEEIVEEAMPTLVGGLLANIGAAIVSGDSDMSDLENLGDDIEQKVEAKAAVIEEKAEKFCNRLKEVDEIEQQLVASDSAFAHFDLIKVETKNYQHNK